MKQVIFLLTLIHIDKDGYAGSEYTYYHFAGFSLEDCYKQCCDFVNKKWLDTVDLSIPSKGYHNHLDSIFNEVSDNGAGDDAFEVSIASLDLEIKDDMAVGLRVVNK